MIRTRPGYGAFESTPPDTESPSPRGPLIISTLNVQSEKIQEEWSILNFCFKMFSLYECEGAAGNWKTLMLFPPFMLQIKSNELKKCLAFVHDAEGRNSGVI